jgi:hypothetical protein
VKYIYETENYGVIVGKSQSPDNADNDVYQIVHKEHGVVEYETREIGQACFRCNVVQRLVDTNEWQAQWANYLSAQESAEAVATALPEGTDPDIADVEPGEVLPGEEPVETAKKADLKSVN